jgi:hypothetical protein
MITIELGKAQTGMVLARPVKNESGTVLVKEGTELTVKVIARLRHWGATMVCIEGGEEELSPEEKGRKRQEIIHRFQDVTDNPLMMKIRDIVLKQLEMKWDESSKKEESE